LSYGAALLLPKRKKYFKNGAFTVLATIPAANKLIAIEITGNI
jgi:hypothetical protein